MRLTILKVGEGVAGGVRETGKLSLLEITPWEQGIAPSSLIDLLFIFAVAEAHAIVASLVFTVFVRRYLRVTWTGFSYSGLAVGMP